MNHQRSPWGTEHLLSMKGGEQMKMVRISREKKSRKEELRKEKKGKKRLDKRKQRTMNYCPWGIKPVDTFHSTKSCRDSEVKRQGKGREGKVVIRQVIWRRCFGELWGDDWCSEDEASRPEDTWLTELLCQDQGDKNIPLFGLCGRTLCLQMTLFLEFCRNLS